MTWSDIEYISLRLLRRWIVRGSVLSRLHNFLPYYKRSDVFDSQHEIIHRLNETLQSLGWEGVQHNSIIEVGCGETNILGYAMAVLQAKVIWCYEPNRAWDEKLDQQLLNRFNYPQSEQNLVKARVKRTTSLSDIPNQSVDIIFSYAVVEHVSDLVKFFSELATKMKSTGIMIHQIDFRDHFFKYPYHFLKFSSSTWKRFLDPGDLPRWRLSNVLKSLSEAGFESIVNTQEILRPEYMRVQAHISTDFDQSDPLLPVARAQVVSHRKSTLT